ncbi:hypothetical protein SMACR_02759 [Sordaria macrospora]|uniref:WGS project CABT00000000 data, contig 2.11 n=2 Tax=Sordaria macrospora TaxID=5147 RepID=F7VXD9_SORMK|nr:uncharacterized protein SMAC_02759 [Sordaria macrospora k-hell]KAA8627963.1 hypothetical protein SMACR_02759 [Sordaria macrospora]KAH7633152.1 hypothetical protein B0T09DRAFT_300893 [Sordaria sp. MPI-SDFR-AT-0083]WPJ60408.1 hypothetical protein SMAC4_02759 [Sordaria macrospora]CCC10181.1 unnamed protein product [Sordaria macrospora k-hell]
MLLATRFRLAFKLPEAFRSFTTLASNPNIKVFPLPNKTGHLLTLLPTSPPSPTLSIGTTTTLPPTPQSFTTNPHFLSILNSVLSEHAYSDPGLQSQAQAFASPAGFSFLPGSAGAKAGGAGRRTGKKGNDTGAGGASAEGGAGGAGRGGWVHLSDERTPVDFGRIAWPEDIFGSVEVDGRGKVLEGTFQGSGTYRVVTNQGILGLGPFLMEKLVARLREEEAKEKQKA